MIQQELFGYDYESEAIAFIRSNATDKPVFVGFSGGKDSIVTANLMQKSGINHTLYYSFTGIDAPEVVQFIRKHYPDCVFLKPRQTFWRALSVNVPPSNRLRWCCTTLKKEPAWQIKCSQRFMGIRAEESPARAKQGRINDFWKTKRGFIDYYPIFTWKEWQIWEYIEKHNLEVPPLYEWGFDRIGCVVCPYHSGRDGLMHEKYRTHWPKFFDLWEREIGKLWHKRQDSGKHMSHDTPDEFLHDWYRHNAARWYASGGEK